MSDRRDVIFNFLKVSGFLKHLDDVLSGLEPFLANKYLGLFVETSVIVYDVQDRKMVPEAYFIVVYVVSRSDLEASGSEIHCHIIILDNRNLPVYQRN